MKDKKAKTVLHGFIVIVNESKPKLNKLWFDQEKKFCNNLMQKWSDNSDILMNLTHKVDRPVVTKRFIRTLNNKIYEKITTFDCKSYLGCLNKLGDEYNNSYHYAIGKSLLILIILL